MAPIAAIDAVEAATKLPFEEGVKRESELFQECLFSDQSKGLIHVFFGEREVAKIPGISKDTPQIPVTKAAVVGAGTMGGGIAMVFANAGIPVLLKETDQAALDRGLATIQKNYANSVAKGRLTQKFMDERMALIRPQLTYDGLWFSALHRDLRGYVASSQRVVSGEEGSLNGSRSLSAPACRRAGPCSGRVSTRR